MKFFSSTRVGCRPCRDVSKITTETEARPMVHRPSDMSLDPRLEQAADWHARLQDDADQSVWLEFTQWLEADPTHRAAYDQVEALWRQLDGLPPAAGATIIDLAGRRTQHALARPSRRWFLGGAAAAAAAVALTLAGQYATGPTPQIFETQPGQRRTVQLADGSSVTLNSGTRLTVAMADDRRSLVLERGEALFDVAKDPARPFSVAAGDRLVTVVGTAFNVRHLDRSVVVTVARGLVDVARQDGGDKIRLTPGQQIAAHQGQPHGPVAAVDAQAVTAWIDGRLSFDNAPLAQVLVELSRHYPVPMRADAGAADLRFSGVLRLDRDQAAVLATLQGLMPIVVARRDDSFVLSKRP